MNQAERQAKDQSFDPDAPGNYDPCEPTGEEKVGIVISGAAARGPYQAGAIAELLQFQDRNDQYFLDKNQLPVIILGTSSGAINGALLAQFAHHRRRAGKEIERTWRELKEPFRNTYLSLPANAAKLISGALDLPTILRRISQKVRFRGYPRIEPATSLLETSPLRRFAAEHFRPENLKDNIDKRLVWSVGAAATFCPPGHAAARTRLFIQGESPKKDLEPDHAIDVVETQLTTEHLLASAAIPILFPPQQVTKPAEYRGYYIDGGVRLNSPLATALSMGVTRLIIVSGHSVAYSHTTPPDPTDQAPDLATSLAITMRSVLTDGLSDDLLTLGRRNELVRYLAKHMRREQLEQLPYRCVPYLVVSPPDGELARMASEHFDPALTDSYFPIGRLLAAAGEGAGRNELLSLIFFDRDYTEAQIKLGHDHAARAMNEGWRIGPQPNP